MTAFATSIVISSVGGFVTGSAAGVGAGAGGSVFDVEPVRFAREATKAIAPTPSTTSNARSGIHRLRVSVPGLFNGADPLLRFLLLFFVIANSMLELTVQIRLYSRRMNGK